MTKVVSSEIINLHVHLPTFQEIHTATITKVEVRFGRHLSRELETDEVHEIAEEDWSLSAIDSITESQTLSLKYRDGFSSPGRWYAEVWIHHNGSLVPLKCPSNSRTLIVVSNSFTDNED